MGTRGLKIVRYRGRYYVFYNHFDSYPEGWPSELVQSIPKDSEAYKAWLIGERTQFEGYHQALETYLSVVRIEPPEDIKDTETAGTRQVSCSGEPSAATDSTWNQEYTTEGLPHYTTQANDAFLAWIYTIDLDREVFTVDNKIHFKLDQVSRVDWMAPFTEKQRNIDAVPRSALAMIARPLTANQDQPSTPYARLLARKVRAKRLKGFEPAQRHGVLLCATYFQRFRRQEMFTFEHLLGSWTLDDFAFQEYAWMILCLASLSRNVSLEHSSNLLGHNRGGYLDLVRDTEEGTKPELVALPGTGAHLDSQPPGAWPKTSTFEFEGAVIRLVPELEDSEDGVMEQIALLHQYCQAHYENRNVNAALLSVASVVLLKLYPDGKMEHTDCLPICKPSNDRTLNPGMTRMDTQMSHQNEDRHETEVEASSESAQDKIDSRGIEVKMTGLMEQLIFGPGSPEDMSRIAAGFQELQAESGQPTASEDARGPQAETSREDEHNTDGGVTRQAESKRQHKVEEDESSVCPVDEESVEKDHESVSGHQQSTHQQAGDTDGRDDDEGNESGEKGTQAASGTASLVGTSMTIIPTEDGFLIKRYNADGTEKSTEKFRETVLNGTRITERVKDNDIDTKHDEISKNAGFYALAQFLDSVAKEALAPFRHSTSGSLPLEAYRLIINNVPDMATYRACMKVSQLFRDICMENFRLDDDTLFIANETTRGDHIKAAQLVEEEKVVCNSIDCTTGEREEYLVGKPKRSTFGDYGEDEEYFVAVIGNERDKRIAISGTETVFRTVDVKS